MFRISVRTDSPRFPKLFGPYDLPVGKILFVLTCGWSLTGLCEDGRGAETGPIAPSPSLVPIA